MTIKKLTPQQSLQSMDAKWKFIAKDKDGGVWVYDEKPTESKE